MLMKKFITLLLVLTGMVLTASAKKIYFVNNFNNINTLKLYLFNSASDHNTWPGDAFPSAETFTIDGMSVYHLDLGTWSNFIITFKFNGEDAQRQTVDCSSSSYSEGDYVDFSSSWSDGKANLTTALTRYTYNIQVTTATTWPSFNIWMWNGSDNLTGTDWPGINVTGSENTYSHTHYSFKPNISILFNQGNAQPQTGDLWANPGDNNFYIASVASSKRNESWGEGVKTNGSGYATYVTYNPLTIPENIAYYATDNNNGSATAHNITDPAASTPMLIKGTANTIYHFAPLSVGDGTDYSSTNAFHAGSDAALESGTAPYNYILNGNSFYLANGQYVAANKAYLALSVAASARPLIFEDEDATAIKAITTVNSENNAYFNIAGQRVAQPTKGLYIVNGKKVVIK